MKSAELDVTTMKVTQTSPCDEIRFNRARVFRAGQGVKVSIDKSGFGKRVMELARLSLMRT
jgi:hypothetical protein